MKIWMMNHYATQMLLDKAGRHYWFANELIKRNYDVTVFCASTYLKNQNKIDTQGEHYLLVKQDKVPFVIIDVPSSTGNGLKRVLNMTSFALNLYKVASRIIKKIGKPDIILASSVHPLTMVSGILISRKLKVPCICEIRDLWPEAIFSFGKISERSLLGRILTGGEHWIYKNADALIFTKEGDTDYLKEKGWTVDQGGDIDLEKCFYINNGVNLEDFDFNLLNNKIEDDDLNNDNYFNVTYAGIIRPINDIDNILDCAKIIQEKNDNIKFIIYGEGSELHRLKKRIVDEQIENVKFKGNVEKKYIPYILSKSSVNLLNYGQTKYNWTRGNSSNKLFEYMASRKPIISTVKMGYSLIKKYKCGIELEECTPDSLARAILEIYYLSEDDFEAYSNNARKASLDFDFKILTAELEKVIIGVMKND